MKLILAHNLVEMLDKVSIPLFLYGRAHLVSSLLAVPYSLRWVVLLNYKNRKFVFSRQHAHKHSLAEPIQPRPRLREFMPLLLHTHHVNNQSVSVLHLSLVSPTARLHFTRTT